MNLAQTDRIYQNLVASEQGGSLEQVTYEWPEMADIISKLRGFDRQHPEYRDNDAERAAFCKAWERVNMYNTLPVQPADVSSAGRTDMTESRDSFQGSHSDRQRALVAILDAILNLVANPLLEELVRIHAQMGQQRVALYARNDMDVVSDLVAPGGKLHPWALVDRKTLRHEAGWDVIVFAGNPSKVPGFIMDSGRSGVAVGLHLKGVYSGYRKNPAFSGCVPVIIPVASPGSSPAPIGTAPSQPVDEDDFNPWPFGMSAHSISIITKGGRVTEFDEDDEVFVIDTDADTDIVSKEHASKLTVGMLVMLRDRDLGGAVAAVADRLMGDKAKELRTIQDDWKWRVAEYVKRHGYDFAVGRLRVMGCARARVNLRGWMSPSRSRIGVQDQEDLRKILELVGIAERTENYFSAFRELRGWHKQAGDAIKARIQGRITEMGERKLSTTDEFTIKFEEFPGERIVATRIMAIRHPKGESEDS